MDWYKIDLSSEQLISGILLAMRDRFTKASITAGNPKGFAVFSEPVVISNQQGNKLHNHLYISPITVRYCQDIIADYPGIVCEKPLSKSKRLSLFCGSQEEWELVGRPDLENMFQ